MRVIKQLVFILLYGLVIACVGFTIITLFGLPSYFTTILAVPAVFLADRVGQGFGVQIFRRSERPAELKNQP